MGDIGYVAKGISSFFVGTILGMVMWKVVDPLLTTLSTIDYNPLPESTVAIVWFFVIIVMAIMMIVYPAHLIHQGMTSNG